jgi:hypothetical protein
MVPYVIKKPLERKFKLQEKLPAALIELFTT